MVYGIYFEGQEKPALTVQALDIAQAAVIASTYYAPESIDRIEVICANPVIKSKFVLWTIIREIGEKKGKELSEDDIDEIYGCLDCIIIEELAKDSFGAGYAEVERQMEELI